MAATLLACGGAGLIAGAPDWVTRVALAKTRPTVLGTAQDAQRPRETTKDVTATTLAEASGSSHGSFAGAIRPPPSGLDVAMATDQPDLERFLVERTCGGAPRLRRASDLEGREAQETRWPDRELFSNAGDPAGNGVRMALCPSSPPARARASSKR